MREKIHTKEKNFIEVSFFFLMGYLIPSQKDLQKRTAETIEEILDYYSFSFNIMV